MRRGKRLGMGLWGGGRWGLGDRVFWGRMGGGRTESWGEMNELGFFVESWEWMFE